MVQALSDLITLSEAARLLSVTRMTVYAMINRGELHRCEVLNNPYVLRSEVEAVKVKRNGDNGDNGL